MKRIAKVIGGGLREFWPLLALGFLEKLLQLDPRDNVLIALSDLRQGDQVTYAGQTYRLATDVGAKHNSRPAICRRVRR